MNIPQHWRPWQISDSIYMRPFKLVFYTITLVSFGWVVPLRNLARHLGMYRTVNLLNNTPNGLTVIRGIVSLPAVAIFGVLLWQRDPHAATWFWITLGLFLLDAIDGPLARMLQYTTEFGRKADPAVDKLLVGALTIALPIITWKMQGAFVGITLLVALVWLLLSEIQVARMGIRTNSLATTLGESVHGAYTAGKIKFNLEAIAFLLSYSFLIWEPLNLRGTLGASVLFCIARTYADKSLADHSQELRKLEDLSSAIATQAESRTHGGTQ